jgi:hypothetical protein
MQPIIGHYWSRRMLGVCELFVEIKTKLVGLTPKSSGSHFILQSRGIFTLHNVYFCTQLTTARMATIQGHHNKCFLTLTQGRGASIAPWSHDASPLSHSSLLPLFHPSLLPLPSNPSHYPFSNPCNCPSPGVLREHPAKGPRIFLKPICDLVHFGNKFLTLKMSLL